RVGFGFVTNDGSTQNVPEASGGWSRRLKEDLPEVEQILRALHANFPTTIENKAPQKSVLVNDVRWGDSQVAEVVDLRMIAGNTAGLFDDPNTIVIARTAAKTLFGNDDPVGKILAVKDNQYMNGKEANLTVVGVYEDFPLNSTFRFQYLINLQSLRSFASDFDQAVENAGFESYVVLREGASEENMLSYLKTLSEAFRDKNSPY